MKTSQELFTSIINRQTKEIVIESRNYRVSCDLDRLGIYDSNDFHELEPFFLAEYEHGFLSLDINTKSRTGEKAPGLYAQELVAISLEYFRRTRGDVIGIHARWNQAPGESDNYVQYTEALAQGKTKEEAAFQTWTGKLAKQLGFRHARQVGSYFPKEFVNFVFFKSKLDSLYKQP